MANSSYFQNLTNPSPIEFSLSYSGMGLPADLFMEYALLLTNLTGQNNTYCQYFPGGVCIVNQTCETLTSLIPIAFQIQFASNTNVYMNVPLGAFAESTSFGTCSFRVNYLDVQPTANNIMLGGTFFQEFMGIFNNQYEQTF